MKRLTVRADEVKVGDRLADPDTGEAGPKVLAVESAVVAEGNGRFGGMEFWTDLTPDSIPTIPYRPSDQVEVWR